MNQLQKGSGQTQIYIISPFSPQYYMEGVGNTEFSTLSSLLNALGSF